MLKSINIIMQKKRSKVESSISMTSLNSSVQPEQVGSKVKKEYYQRDYFEFEHL